jgi:hypothetical protein
MKRIPYTYHRYELWKPGAMKSDESSLAIVVSSRTLLGGFDARAVVFFIPMFKEGK